MVPELGPCGFPTCGQEPAPLVWKAVLGKPAARVVSPVVTGSGAYCRQDKRLRERVEDACSYV